MDNRQQIFLQLLLTTIQGVGGQELQHCVPLSFACFFFKQDKHYTEPKNLLGFQHAS